MDTDQTKAFEIDKTLEENIQEAIQDNLNIRQSVRWITIKALSEGKLDVHEISSVVRSVIEGAKLSVDESDIRGNEKLAEAIAGLDDALCCAAEASMLALQEAVWNIKTFNTEDLKSATDDLLSLEGVYIDSLKNAAQDASETVATTLNNLALHGQRCGTAVGQRTVEVVETLNQELGRTIKQTAKASSDVALQVTSNLAFAGAGFLEGIAQTLDAKLTPPCNKKK